MNLNAMYSELIFEHDKRPQNSGLREGHHSEVHHVNPTCGDEITLRVHLERSDDELRIADLSYEAVGCAMSRASASIMTDLLIGETVSKAHEILEYFDHLMHQRGKEQGDEAIIGDGVALVGAAKFPGRVKCVLMAWKAYQAAVVEARAACDS